MPAVILRLLTLAAVVLMPFGMGAAVATAAHHAPASAAAGHCEEQESQPAEQSSDQAIDCAIACSMLATTEARADEPAPSLCLARGRPLAERGSGLHPDTATPPPKLS